MITKVDTAEYACLRPITAEERKIIRERYQDPTILTGREELYVFHSIFGDEPFCYCPDDDFDYEVRYTVNLEDKLKIDESCSIRFSVGDDVETIKKKMVDSSSSIRDKFLALCIMANLNPDAFWPLDKKDKNVITFGPSKFSEGYNGKCIYL